MLCAKYFTRGWPRRWTMRVVYCVLRRRRPPPQPTFLSRTAVAAAHENQLYRERQRQLFFITNSFSSNERDRAISRSGRDGDNLIASLNTISKLGPQGGCTAVTSESAAAAATRKLVASALIWQTPYIRTRHGGQGGMDVTQKPPSRRHVSGFIIFFESSLGLWSGHRTERLP